MPMPSSADIPRRDILILDTGPIWELVLYRAVNNLGFEGLRNRLKFIPDQNKYEKFSEFLVLFGRKTTTPSVIAELSDWIQKTDKTGLARIWQRVYEECKRMRMEEEIIRLLEMPIELVAQVGVIDGTVLQLGLRFAQFRPQILTVDWALAKECRRAGLHATHLTEIVA